MKPSHMGQLVVVKAVLHKKKYYSPKDHNVRAWAKLTYEPRQLGTPRPGWLVGKRNLPCGSVEPGWDDCPPVFHGSGVIPAYAVVFWPTMAPVYVMGSDLTYDDNAKPWPPNGSPEERKRMQDWAEKYPHQFPRDSKGRFK